MTRNKPVLGFQVGSSGSTISPLPHIGSRGRSVSAANPDLRTSKDLSARQSLLGNSRSHEAKDEQLRRLKPAGGCRSTPVLHAASSPSLPAGKLARRMSSSTACIGRPCFYNPLENVDRTAEQVPQQIRHYLCPPGACDVRLMMPNRL